VDDSAETQEKLKQLEAYRAAFWPHAEYNDTHVALTLAESYLSIGHFKEAARLLLSIVKKDPTNALAHSRLGDAYWRWERFEEAVESFADAESHDSEGKLVSDAIDQIVQGPLKGARGIGVLLRLIPKYPSNLGLIYSLAWAYRIDGQLSEAAAQFQHLLSLNPPSDGWRADIELELSAVLSENGELAASVELVEKALPRLGNQWNRRQIEEGLFQDYLDLGRFEDALKICLHWLNEATPSVGLTGDISAPHSRYDSHTYEKVQKSLSRLLSSIRQAAPSKQSEVSASFYGKLNLALSRCYEEMGDSVKAERAHNDAMRHFGKDEPKAEEAEARQAAPTQVEWSFEERKALAKEIIGRVFPKDKSPTEETIRGLLRLATESNDAMAQGLLGHLYYSGRGVSQDYTAAAKWFRKAAEQNLDAAQFNLALCYANGQGVAKDDAEAVKWYRKAAEQNLSMAQFQLGLRLAQGQGVPSDFVESTEWFRKAAEQNLAMAQSALGFCYSEGRGVAENHVEAAKWFRKAAEQNEAFAQYTLGWCYLEGKGVTEDYAEAYKWSLLAVANGCEQARENVTKLEGSLTREQIVEAQRLVRRLKLE
jgi:TPR repeat protein